MNETNNMYNTMNEKDKKNIRNVIMSVGILLSLFLLASTVRAMRETRFVGSGVQATNTIAVTGQGKVEKSPDTAKISFSVRTEKKDLKSAQTEVSTKIDTITKALSDTGIDKKYVKTDSYTSYPQYNYTTTRCIDAICSPSQSPVLRGYEVQHSVTVSIKDLEKVESVLGILGSGEVSDISGPNFGFEDDKAIAREARDEAIDDAKDEAKKLASSLGVTLVRVVSFSDNTGGGYPVPMYNRDMISAQSAKMEISDPVVPVGAQNVSASVTVVYEIR